MSTPDDDRVAHCVMSIQSQCLFYRPDRFKSAVAPGWAPATDDAVAEIGEHIVRFSLAGIAAVRDGNPLPLPPRRKRPHTRRPT